MSTTYKLFNASNSDGLVFIDLPIGGKITQIAWTMRILSAAGAPGYQHAELSRSPVNQVTVNNPRGVLSVISGTAAAASQAAAANRTDKMSEPISAGERLYLNCASYATLDASQVTALVTLN